VKILDPCQVITTNKRANAFKL